MKRFFSFDGSRYKRLSELLFSVATYYIYCNSVRIEISTGHKIQYTCYYYDKNFGFLPFVVHAYIKEHGHIIAYTVDSVLCGGGHVINLDSSVSVWSRMESLSPLRII